MASIEEYKRNSFGVQKELTKLDRMILTCAADAKISTAQWDTIFEAAGLEEIKDILELEAGDFDSIKFKPLLQNRVGQFQRYLFERYWSTLVTSPAESTPPKAKAPPPAHLLLNSGAPPPPKEPAPCPETEPAPSPKPTDRLCQKHEPTKNRREDLNYWFFNAIKDGCEDCVKVLVQELGVDKDVTSDTQNYSAKQFAEWFHQPHMNDILDKL